MARRLRCDLFCEDSGHEQFVGALVRRLAREEECEVILTSQSTRGGHGRAIAELKVWQRLVTMSGRVSVPDLLIVVIDANCEGWAQAQRRTAEAVDREAFPRVIIGSPDPHVERWCIADPEGFAKVVGRPPKRDPGKCDRDRYKDLLRQSIQAAHQPILTNEMEFAPDLVKEMDLFRAGKNQPSLKHFVDELRAALRSRH